MIYVFHRDAHKDLPAWIEFLAFVVLAKLLRIKVASKRGTASTSGKLHSKNCCGKGNKSNILLYSPEYPNNDFTSVASRNSEDAVWRSCVHKKLQLLSGKIQNLEENLSNEMALKERKRKWHQLAHILDSLFFWIFVVSMVTSTVIFYQLIPTVSR